MTPNILQARRLGAIVGAADEGCDAEEYNWGGETCRHGQGYAQIRTYVLYYQHTSPVKARALSALSDKELADPSRYRWMGGEPVGSVIGYSFERAHSRALAAIKIMVCSC